MGYKKDPMGSENVKKGVNPREVAYHLQVLETARKSYSTLCGCHWQDINKCVYWSCQVFDLHILEWMNGLFSSNE